MGTHHNAGDRRSSAALAGAVACVLTLGCGGPRQGASDALPSVEGEAAARSGVGAAPEPGARPSAAAKGGDTERGECASPSGGCAIPPDLAPDAAALNVLGGPLETCSRAPLTGWRRSGRCETGPRDRGVHVVCAQVTDTFLAYSAERGNDLVTARPDYGFPGLRDGDRWCLCAARWLEAVDGGVAPPVVLSATEDSALRFMSVDTLRSRAVDVTPDG